MFLKSMNNNIGFPLYMSIGKPIVNIGKLISMDKQRTAFGARLFEARKNAGLSQAQVKKKTGMAQATLSELENTANGSSYTAQLAALYGVSALWLAEGKGESKSVSGNKSQLTYAEGETPGSDIYAMIPQLDLKASCGAGNFTDHVVVKGGLVFKRSTLRDFGLTEATARIIYADGQSMEPTIKDGRVVLINLNESKVVDGKIFLVCDPDGAVYLKRLVREFSEKAGSMVWIMRSDNANKVKYPDKPLPDDENTRLIGRAVWTDDVL